MRPATLSLRPGEWGIRSRSIAVLGEGDSWSVLDQPSPVGDEVPKPSEATSALQGALRSRGHISPVPSGSVADAGATAIYSLPCGGPVVFASSRDQLSALREDYGSAHWRFCFLLLARQGPEQESLTCELPVAVHRAEDRSLISHKTGKRTQTNFRRILTGETLTLWEARTAFLRPDQIRLHASEVGIAIAGEDLYGTGQPISRPDLPATRKPGGKKFVLFPGPALHLAELAAPVLSEVPFRSQPPKAFLKWILAHGCDSARNGARVSNPDQDSDSEIDRKT